MEIPVHYLCNIPNLSENQRLYLHHHQLNASILYDINKDETARSENGIIVGYTNENQKEAFYLKPDGKIYNSSGVIEPVFPDYVPKKGATNTLIYLFMKQHTENGLFQFLQSAYRTHLEQNQTAGFEFSKEQTESLVQHVLDLAFIEPLNVMPQYIIDQHLYAFDPEPSAQCLDEDYIEKKEKNTDDLSIMTYVIIENVIKWVKKFKPTVNEDDLIQKMDKAIVVGISEDSRPILLKNDGWFSDGIHDYWPSYELIRLDDPSVLQQPEGLPFSTPVYRFVRYYPMDTASPDYRYKTYNLAFKPSSQYIKSILSNVSSVFNPFGAVLKTTVKHFAKKGGKKYTRKIRRNGRTHR